MAYTINKYNGQQLAQIADTTINSNTCDIKLIGRNYAGYGEAQNENFVHLLENFARDTQPSFPIRGQLWFDTTTKTLKFYDDSVFKAIARMEVSNIAPSSTNFTVGNLWFDTASSQVKAWDGNDFIVVGPEQSLISGLTKMRVRTVRDTPNGNLHVIIEALIENQTIFVISSDTFTLDQSTPINGFDVIHEGTTLVNTTAEFEGATSSSHRWWGTASNADKISVDTTPNRYAIEYTRDPEYNNDYVLSVRMKDQDVIQVTPTGDTMFHTVSGSGSVLLLDENNILKRTPGAALTVKKFVLMDPDIDTYDQTTTVYTPSSAQSIDIKSLNAAPLWGIASTYDISDENDDRCVFGFQDDGSPGEPVLGLIMKNKGILQVTPNGDLYLLNIKDLNGGTTGSILSIGNDSIVRRTNGAALTVKKFALMDPNIDDYDPSTIEYTPTSAKSIDIKSLNAAPLWGIASTYNIVYNNADRCLLGFQRDRPQDDPVLGLIMKNKGILQVTPNGDLYLLNIKDLNGGTTGSILSIGNDSIVRRTNGAALTVKKFALMDPNIDDYDPSTIEYTPTSAKSIDIKSLNAAPLWGIASTYDVSTSNADRCVLGFQQDRPQDDPILGLIMKGDGVLNVFPNGDITLSAVKNSNGSNNGTVLALDEFNVIRRAPNITLDYWTPTGTPNPTDLSISSYGTKSPGAGSAINLYDTTYVYSTHGTTGLVVSSYPNQLGELPLRGIMCSEVTETSDIRLKTNVNKLDYGLNTVMSLNPVSFNWIASLGNSNRRCVGLISQEVQEHVPELVDEQPDGHLGISYSKFVPILINAIQELKTEYDAIITELRQEIAELKQK